MEESGRAARDQDGTKNKNKWRNGFHRFEGGLRETVLQQLSSGFWAATACRGAILTPPVRRSQASRDDRSNGCVFH